MATMGDRIRELRIAAKMTQKDLALRLNVKDGAVSKWESGTVENIPRQTIQAMADLFNVSPPYLMAFSDDPGRSGGPGIVLSALEASMVRDFRKLDSFGQETVRAVIKCELKRCQSPDAEMVKYYQIPVLRVGAAAGIATPMEDAGFDMVDLVKPPPLRTSFGLRISGDSMEPKYHDGDIVFVREASSISSGQIGFFTIGMDCYVKQAGISGLISLNRKYAPIAPVEGGDPIVCRGIVLGVADESYFPK